MPHSSGGGSHSGGSHSSSSSSRSSGGGSRSGGYHSASSYSSRSSGGSHSSGYHSASSYSSRSGGGARDSSAHTRYGAAHGRSAGTAPVPPPRPTVSAARYQGATRYVYYRDQQPHYLFSNYTACLREKRRGVLFGWLIFIAMLIIGAVGIYTPPDRLKTDYDHTIVIEDGAGVLTQTDALHSAMNAFFDKTGITPAVITVSDTDWQTNYRSLSVYALELYVNRFTDERHWLIVYSDAQPDETGFVDWQWEGIQGDETDKIITQKAADQFGVVLTRNLMASSRMTVTEAITVAFETLTPTLMKAEGEEKSYSMTTIIFLIGIFLLVALWHSGYLQLKPSRPAELPKDAVAAPESSAELTCAYCTGVYLNDLRKCPYCGAPKSSSNRGHT